MNPIAARCLPTLKERSAGQALLIMVVALLVYLPSGLPIPTGDALPARYLPMSLLQEGDFDLDEFPWLYAGARPYYLQSVRGHFVSSYPVGPALVATPVYLPLAFVDVDPMGAWPGIFEKLAASIVVAVSIVALFFALRRMTTTRIAWILATLYAFGTTSLSQSSQALWQHGPGQLALCAAIYAVGQPPGDRRWMWMAGFCLAMAVVCRPVNLLLVLALAGWSVMRSPRRFVDLLAGGAPLLVFQYWYNLQYFGDPLHTQFPLFAGSTWSTPILDGLPGILLSPGRGLLVYSPIFAGCALGIVQAWRRDGNSLLRWLSAGVVATLLLDAKWTMWWGGICYGPRLLGDLTPALTLLLVPAVPSLLRHRSTKILAVVVAAWSIGMHAIGAYCGDYGWNLRVDVDRHPERLWSWSDNQPVECVRTLGCDAAALLTGNPRPPHPGLPPDGALEGHD
ncbi:MAG: hypothetical protein HYX75_16745 [Acidobacteria bacterium]|nr:hypothetical protein [Acidobacteriota bacterium]